MLISGTDILPFSSWGNSADYVPIDEWLPCTTEQGGQEASDVSYQFYTKPFAIGNFSFAVRQNFTETTYDP